MIHYKDFQPTAFDTKGLLGEYHKISEFWVAPVSQTRDSECLERANFDATLKALGGESKCVQVHRFGHWGPGWFEIILISPTARKKVKIAQDIEAALSDYPVVDDELFSQYENDTQWETITGCARSDLAKAIEKHFDIEDLDLTDDCLSYLWHDNWIEIEGEGWPSIQFEQKWNNSNLTLSYLIDHGCDFTFTEDTNVQSITHPDLPNAQLFRSLALADTKGKKYFNSDSTEITVPDWAYPNPNQVTMELK